MQIFQFKGMVVRHHETTRRFEIVGPPSAAEIRKLRFQVPPPFLWWPAKDVMVAVLVLNALVTAAFLFNSTDLFACILLSSIAVSLMFAAGYIHESFTAIYSHLFFCIAQIIIFSALIPIAYCNQIICNNEYTCKTIFQWMAGLGIPFSAPWVYVFAGISLISHIFMTPVSFRLMRFAAAVDALERMARQEEIIKWENCV